MGTAQAGAARSQLHRVADRADPRQRGRRPRLLAARQHPAREAPRSNSSSDTPALGREGPDTAAELRWSLRREDLGQDRDSRDRWRGASGRARPARRRRPRDPQVDAIEMAELDPDAQRVLDLIREAGRPPYETLTPLEAREFYRAGRRILQPDPP